MSKLFRIVYCSRSRLTDDPEIRKAELEQILATSRRNNTRNDLTGALLFNNGEFAQVLEGTLVGIQATLALIERDPRHDHVRVLELGPIEAREFGDWAMAFAGRRVTDNPLLGHAMTEAFSNPSPAAGEVLGFLRQAIGEPISQS